MSVDLLRTFGLLALSSSFMTVAWYGHLKFKGLPLLTVILGSWLIALPEYALQVPANRYGHRALSAPQLKIMAEAVAVLIFLVFNRLYLGDTLRWNHAAAFCLVLAGLGLALWKPA